MPAETIRKVLAGRELAPRLSRAGKARAGAFAVETIADQYRRIFLENSSSSI